MAMRYSVFDYSARSRCSSPSTKELHVLGDDQTCKSVLNVVNIFKATLSKTVQWFLPSNELLSTPVNIRFVYLIFY